MRRRARRPPLIGGICFPSNEIEAALQAVMIDGLALEHAIVIAMKNKDMAIAAVRQNARPCDLPLRSSRHTELSSRVSSGKKQCPATRGGALQNRRETRLLRCRGGTLPPSSWLAQSSRGCPCAKS